MNSNVLLISEDALKTYSNLNKNTFGDWILPAIREAQEMGLMPIIGECLYNKICELVADGSINDVLFTAYKDLLDDKIQPYLIYKTLSNIIPILNAKMANLGVVVTNDEHVVNLTQSESDLLKSYYSERCDFYAKRLQDFIKSNQSAFPEISCGCGKMQPNLESSENSVGVWLGGSRGKKIGNNNCTCSSTEVTQSDYQSGFTDGVEFQKRKLEITAVTENGRYIREDGYSEVTVNVPQTGASGTEILLTGDTRLTQYGRYYFDYDENTDIPNIIINFGSTGTTGTTGITVMNYTSTDGNLVTPSYIEQAFMGRLISNTYENGIGTFVFDKDIEVLNNFLFSGCETLRTITLPNKLKSIGEIGGNVFDSCHGLIEITIPSSVTSIGNSSFFDCDSLTSVRCLPATPPSLGIGVFAGSKNAVIYVPAASVDAYKTAQGWSEYADRIQAIA